VTDLHKPLLPRRVVPMSVAVATRERPDALARCLRALLAGNVLPAEVVVVDQGHGEETRRFITALSMTAPVAVRYVHQRAEGLSRSRNEGFAVASHEIIAVTDEDCVPDRGWVEALWRALEVSPAAGAATGRVLPLGDPEPGTFATSTRAGHMPADFTGRTLPWLVGTGANFATRRSVLLSLRGYDERLGVGTPGGAGEDLDLLDRLLGAGVRVRYEPAALVYHERKSLAGRLATRLSYGRGIGALCGLRLRAHDTFGLHVLRGWISLRGTLLARAVRQRDLRTVGEELLVLRGTVAGLCYGWCNGRKS
jgi:GT2 family glycosyltransferase